MITAIPTSTASVTTNPLSYSTTTILTTPLMTKTEATSPWETTEGTTGPTTQFPTHCPSATEIKAEVLDAWKGSFLSVKSEFKIRQKISTKTVDFRLKCQKF